MPGNLNRTLGSGTRVTYCFNLFGVFTDLCNSANVSGFADAPTTGDMITNICGIPANDKLTVKSDPTNNASARTTLAGPAPPRVGDNATAGEGFIGYSSRSGVLAPYNNAATGSPDLGTPAANCGIIALGGVTGWNGLCNPNYTSASSTTVIGPGGVANPSQDGYTICPGDLQVSLGQYAAWGYAHLYLDAAAAASGANAEAQAYVAFLQNDPNEQATAMQTGLLRPCQMNVSRSRDAGPYSAGTAAC